MTNVDKVKTSDHDIFPSDMTIKRVTHQHTATGKKSQFLLFCAKKNKDIDKGQEKTF